MYLFEQANDAGGVRRPDSEHGEFGIDRERAYQNVETANPERIEFAPHKAEVAPDDTPALRMFGATLAPPYIPLFPITVTGHASSEATGQDNMTLSERRARNVSDEIVNGGAKTRPRAVGVGQRGAAPTAGWHYAEITVGKLEADHSVVAHEFGHFLRLGDEYPEEAKGRRVGDEVDHSKRAQDTVPGYKDNPVLATHSDSIMSAGNVVRPYHYVTFLEVLGTMTGSVGEWDVRPAPARDGAGPPTTGPAGPVPG